MTDAATLLLAAKVDLMYRHPFYGSIIMQLPFEEVPEGSPIDTMATDGRRIIYSAPFVLVSTREELIFTLAHEVKHVCLMHHVRMGFRDARRWNKACDYAINPELIASGVGKAPADILNRADFAGLKAETIYDMLEDEEKAGGKPQDQPGDDPGGCGGVMPAAAPSETDALRAAEVETQVMIRQAASLAAGRNAGTMPADVADIMDKATKPTVDWRAMLRNFVDQSMTRDYSWSRVNTRMLPHGYVFPSLISTGISHLILAIDTSGSTIGRIASKFAAEAQAIGEESRIDKITMIYADREVRRVDVFENGDPVTIDMVGGGGTSFRDTMRYINEEADPAIAVVYLTDLEVRDFGDEPACPVMWMVYGDERKFDRLAAAVPFGEAVPISA